jgi:hypothetical protein
LSDGFPKVARGTGNIGLWGTTFFEVGDSKIWAGRMGGGCFHAGCLHAAIKGDKELSEGQFIFEDISHAVFGSLQKRPWLLGMVGLLVIFLFFQNREHGQQMSNPPVYNWRHEH